MGRGASEIGRERKEPEKDHIIIRKQRQLSQHPRMSLVERQKQSQFQHQSAQEKPEVKVEQLEEILKPAGPAKKAPQFKLPAPKLISPSRSPRKFSPRKKAAADTKKEKKIPSRYMKEIIKMQFIELVHKYDKHQSKKRAQAVKEVRNDLTKKFIKFYRQYRFKKYGEPLEKKEQWGPGDPFDDYNEPDYPVEIKQKNDILQNQLSALERYMNKGKSDQKKN